MIVELWPNQDSLDATPEGGKVSIIAVAATVAASDGTYRIDIPEDLIPQSYVGGDGTISMQVNVAGSSTVSTWSMSIKPASSVDSSAPFGRWVDASIVEADEIDDAPTPTLDVDLAPGAGKANVASSALGTVEPVSMNGEDMSFNAATSSELNEYEVSNPTDPRTSRMTTLVRQAEAFASGTSVPTTREPICSTSRKELKSGVTAYALKAQGTSRAHVKVDYSVGSHHNYGVAIKSATDNWGVGGTVGIDSSAGASRGWAKTVYAANAVNYRRYFSNCTARDTWRPESINALLSDVKGATRSEYGNCTTYSGGTYWKDAGRNFTLTGGVKFPTIDVSAQVGWNSRVKIAWIFNAKARLCASTSLGWVSSSWAGARPPA